MEIVVLDGYTLNPGDLNWSGLEQLGTPLRVYDRTDTQDIVKNIGNAEIVITNKTPITAETLQACPSIEYVGVLATGYNVVDTAAATEQGVVVTNIPAYSTVAVGQFVFALLLELCHHVGEHNRAVQEGAWASSKDFCFWDYPLVELAGKTFGVLGMGQIGQNAAKVAEGFGMKVIAYAPSATPGSLRNGVEMVSLDRLFADSDVISIHCPLFPTTQGLINRETIAQMKDGVKIINTSRGAVIVEEDLAEALTSGKVSGAAVDVLTEEPPRESNPLIGIENCIITPHIAWAPEETRIRLMDIAVSNVAAFLSGNPINRVNP